MCGTFRDGMRERWDDVPTQVASAPASSKDPLLAKKSEDDAAIANALMMLTTSGKSAVSCATVSGLGSMGEYGEDGDYFEDDTLPPAVRACILRF